MAIATDQKAKTNESSPSLTGQPARRIHMEQQQEDHTAPTWRKRTLILGALIVTAVLVWLLRDFLRDWLVLLSDQEAVSQTIQAYGLWGPLVLAFFQMLQVIVAVIPGHVFVIAGGYVYGFVTGFILNLIFVVTASQLGFLLARAAGRPLVNRLVSSDSLDKWHNIAEKRGFMFFTIAFVLPVFPTDLMNFVAGLTGMSSRKFLAANFLGRTPSVVMLTLIGSHGLEFSNLTWGIMAVIVATVYIVGRYAILRIERRHG